MVQAVAELVEQGGEFGVVEQGRGGAHRRSEVADQVGNRYLQGSLHTAPHPAVVHPGSPALVGPCVQVQVEARDDRVVLQQLEQARIRVVAVEVADLPDRDPVQAFHDLEQPGQDAVYGQVGTQFFLGNLVALLAQLLAVVTHIPGVDGASAEFAAGEVLQRAPLFLGLGTGLPRQLFEKIPDLGGRVGHLGGQ